MATILNSGTQSATINTEFAVYTNTAINRHVCFSVNLVNMVNDDILEIRVYSKTLSGDTEQIVYMHQFAHAQAEKIIYTIPIPATHHVKFSIKQTAGTARNFAWEAIAI